MSGVSFAVLLIQLFYYKATVKHKEVGSFNYHGIFSPAQAFSQQDELTGHAHNLINDPSYKTKAHRFNKATVMVPLEILAVVSEVGINLTTLGVQPWGTNRNSAIVRLAAWSYICATVLLRSLSTRVEYYGARRLWTHTVWLYNLQWLFTVLSFRSTLMFSDKKSARFLAIADLVLTSILALIALTSKQGFKVISLETEDKLEPSKEQSASLLSLGTFSWVDDLVWHGYRKTLNLADVWDLSPEDKTAAVLADFQGLKQASTLTWHLLKYFHKDLLVQGMWALISVVFTFLPIILLQAILETIENPEPSSMHFAWICLVLLALSSCIHTITDNQALWKGRKICVRLRAIIIGEIYTKALLRKAFVITHNTSIQNKESIDGKPESKGSNTNGVNPVGHGNGIPLNKSINGAQADIGTIINLMAVDSFKASEIGTCLHFLWVSAPAMLIVCVLLLYRILGYSSLVSIGLMILIMPLSHFILKEFAQKQKNVMAATDARMQKINETFENIRVIKLFAWERRFVQMINEKRKMELRALRDKYVLWTVATTIWLCIPLLITLFSFLIYTEIAKKPLKPSVAFTSLSLFNILRIPLDQFASIIARVQDFRVSVHRVENFLDEENTKKHSQLFQDDSAEIGESKIGFQNACFAWVEEDSEEEGSTAFRMDDIDIQFHRDQLNVIAGPTGSGKTSLLMALLGEIPLLCGSVNLSGKHTKDSNKDPGTNLFESVAYCAQQPWLINGTIKENILFTSLWNQTRYQSVLEACALQTDLKALGNGDSTLVGDRGVILSGGQKQRIALARALYCSSRYLLLDDCLSAVDSETAQFLFKNCIMGPLMIGRTRILVTHNVKVCVPQSSHVVVLSKGRIMAQGDPVQVMSSGALGEDIFQPEPSLPHSLATSHNLNSSIQGNDNLIDSKFHGPAGISAAMLENKAEGGIKKEAIRFYLAAMGSSYFWIIAFLILVGQQFSSVATSIWIGEWSNSYQPKPMNPKNRLQPIARTQHHIATSNCLLTNTCGWSSPYVSSFVFNAKPIAISNNDDAMYYPKGYALLSVIYLGMCIARTSFIFWGSLRASEKIHIRLLNAVTKAKLDFFDCTPLGRLMNRFSKDIESIDQEIAPFSIALLECAFQIITTVILISNITPSFLIAGSFILILYFIIGSLYVKSSRDLKRLESIHRSPLYQQFGETISGIITIRAFNIETRFLRESHRRVDEYNRPFIYLWATNQWLALRFDFAGVLITFFAGVFILLNAGSINAGVAGLSMTYAISFTKNVLWLVRHYASNEQNMNSVERVKEYLGVDQETKNEETQKPSDWPNEGTIRFIDYSARYQSCLKPVLQNITFSIQPGERVGVVGKTGAGKTSLALALFRGLEAENGKILIDDIDISTIKLQHLREAINLVPQDPTLFKGTIRSNLDPFGVFTDEDILNTLRRVQLINTKSMTAAMESASQDMIGMPPSSTSTNPSDDTLNRMANPGNKVMNTSENVGMFTNLSSFVAESGLNLSHGQRQMLCLGRALLKSPRILVLDEATASLDYVTDEKIQDILREIKTCTIITIAHRLQTIMDYDKVLVLDQGRVVEYDSPWELISRSNGVFRGICEISGDMASLVEAARKAGNQTLIDF